MARLGTRSVKSAQKSTIRYIATTDIGKTARDFGVSEKTLRRFINAKPEQIAQSRSKSYKKILSTDVRAVAKQERVRLVPRLTRDQTLLAKQYSDDPRKLRSVRYTEAITERIRSVDNDGNVHYRLANPERTQNAKNQMISETATWNQNRIVNGYNSGLLSKKEARMLMRKLFANSGVSAARADAAFEKAIGE